MLTLRARGLHGSRAHGCAAKGFVIDMDRVGDKMCGQGRSGWVKCSSACQAPHLPLLKESRTHFFPTGYQEHISTQLLATIWCPFCLSQGLSPEPSVSIRGDEMGCARDNGMGWDKNGMLEAAVPQRSWAPAVREGLLPPMVEAAQFQWSLWTRGSQWRF